MGLRDTIREARRALALKFVKDTLWGLAGTGVQGGFGFATNVVLVQFYGADGLGRFALALSVCLPLQLVTAFGMAGSVAKYASERGDDEGHVRAVLSAALLLVVPISLAVVVLGWLAAPALHWVYRDDTVLALYRVLLVSLPFAAVNKVLLGLLNGLRDMKAYAVFRAARFVLVFAGIVGLHLETGSIRACAWAVPAAEVVLLAALAVRSRLPLRLGRPAALWLKRHLRFGGYGQMHALVADLLFRVDVLIIGALLATTEVGLYAFAADVAKGLTLGAVLIQINFNPVISRLWTERKTADLAAYAARVRKHTYLLHVPVIALAAVGYPLFVYLFKPEMAVGRHFAAYGILLAGVFAYSGYAALLGLMAYTGHVRQQLVRSVAALVVNAAGSALLVPVLGIVGAAVSTCLAFATIILYMRWFARKGLGLAVG